MRLSRCLLGCFLFAAAMAVHATTTLSLIPRPATVELRQGSFVLPATTSVYTSPGDVAAARVAAYLRDETARAHGPRLSIQQGKPQRDAIVLAVDAKLAAGAEGYVLEVTPHGVSVTGKDQAGLFHGVVTLWQLLTRQPAVTELPALHIADAPRFGWRGLMLDSTRHFQSVAEVERLIDQMALHKLNVLHWHLTDDEGWRIEIKRYPKLTSVGAWRTPPGAGRDGEPRRYGGFYTQEQIRAVVRYAADRYITIVPELDLPGHATAAIASYPELGVTGKRMPVSVDWGVHPNLYNVDQHTIDFIEHVLDEVLTLFPSHYIHLGGDEAIKDQWQASPAVQARIHTLGLANEEALQGWLMNQFGEYLAKRGRRMIGWDEILDGRVPDDATVMSWRGIDGAVTAAKKGHDVVLAPSPLLYLDHLQTERADEITGREPAETLADLYAFDPVPKALDASQAKHVLGAQANVWTEHMPTMRHVEWTTFPRIDALSEVVWTAPARHDWDDFLRRLPAQLARYRQAGIRYADSAYAVDIALDRNVALSSGSAAVTLSNQLKTGLLRYTVDGSEPAAQSKVYAAPFNVKLPTTIRAAAFADDGSVLGATRTRVIDRKHLLTRSSIELANCSGENVRMRTQPMPDAASMAPVYVATLFDPCQKYPDARLDGVTGLHAELARVPRNYQLAHDQSQVKQYPARTAHGELEVHLDRCDGPQLASLPLADPVMSPRRFALDAHWPAQQGTHDLCLKITAPKDGPLYLFDHVTLRAASSR